MGKLLLAGGCPIDAVNVEGDAATHIAAREVRTCRLFVLNNACCIEWWNVGLNGVCTSDGDCYVSRRLASP